MAAPRRRSDPVSPISAATVDAVEPGDPVESAKEAGLRYVNDNEPGIGRRRAGRGFRYLAPDGTPVTDERTLARIRSLAIPPAWTDVWICRTPNGHIQATGRDRRGRKQYRYHPRWLEVRDETKYAHLVAFAEVLPRIRSRAREDLARPGLPREKVLALVTRLLEVTLIRVGNDEYARLNGSFGLTTLRTRHARVRPSSVQFRFRGKGGKVHEVGVRDRRLAALVRRCQELPGQELFAYVDEDGEVRHVASDDVNAYLREISGLDISAKDFRTWAGTVLAYRALRALQPADSATVAKRNVVEAIRSISGRLGNTPAVARRSYVHPAVLEAYFDGTLGGALVEVAEEQATPPPTSTPEEETEVIAFLKQRMADAERAKRDVDEDLAATLRRSRRRHR